MRTIAIPRLYCGASGQRGAYNRQEVGLARAFAELGCRVLVLYPAVGAHTVETETPAPGVKVLYLPARALRGNAFYKSWQVLLDEKVDAVHLMSDNALAVPGLYRFCRRHGIFLYNVVGVTRSRSDSAAIRLVMDLLGRRNRAVYRRTPTYAKTAAVAGELQAMGVPCAGVLLVGLDTAIIPQVTETRAALRARLGLDPVARYLLFVGRLDPYKRPLDVAGVLAALPADWQAVVIGQGSLTEELRRAMEAGGLAGRWRHIPKLPNEEVQLYYHACDVFLNCNDREIFGMSLLEAMYAGCTPVARRAPGPDEIIEDGVSGFLVTPAPGDTAALAAAVEKAAADPAMARAAETRIREHFLWRNSAEKALQMLREKGVGTDG